MKYSLDTSAILDGWTRYYPPKTFPSIWRHIEDLIKSGELRATDRVRAELERKADDVLVWAMEQNGLFVPIDEKIQLVVGEIVNKYPGITQVKKGKVRSGADPFVIALAKQHSLTVVTGEKASNKLTDDPHIPDVCKDMKIQAIGFLELIQEQGWSY